MKRCKTSSVPLSNTEWDTATERLLTYPSVLNLLWLLLSKKNGETGSSLRSNLTSRLNTSFKLISSIRLLSPLLPLESGIAQFSQFKTNPQRLLDPTTDKLLSITLKYASSTLLRNTSSTLVSTSKPSKCMSVLTNGIKLNLLSLDTFLKVSTLRFKSTKLVNLRAKPTTKKLKRCILLLTSLISLLTCTRRLKCLIR